MISLEHFDELVNRLQSRFGKSSYPPSVQDLLYPVLKNLGSQDANEIVNWAIGEFRQEPPISKLKEFAQNISRREKHLDKQWTSPPVKNPVHPEVVRDMVNMLNLRFTGKVSKEDFSEYVKDLKRIGAAEDKFNCDKCSDRGEYYADNENGNKCLYNCHCRRGA